MKRIFSFILTAVVLAGCGRTSGEFRVDCSFDQPFSGTVYLQHFANQQKCIDSLVINDQKEASLRLGIDVTDNYVLYTKPYFGTCNFIAQDNASYNFRFNVSEQEGKLISHTSSEQRLLEELENLRQPFSEEMTKISENFNKAFEAEDDETLAAIFEKSRENMNAEQEAVVGFIRQHPDNFVSVYATGFLFFDRYPSFVDVNELLDTVKFGGSASYLSFKKKMDDLAAIWIEGQEAPDFTTKDIHGKTLSLSDFRGKYVLVDFWASWCRPCRLKAKELKKIYPALQKKDIAVLGVSLDERKEDWLKATKEDQIEWNNTCEALPFDNHPIASRYKIRQIPSLFLIGQDGKIVRQNPDAEYLQSLLKD